MELTVNAPCKINLYLDVGERRPDGFHSLDSIFVALSVCDTLKLRERKTEGDGAFTLAMDVRSLPEPLAAPLRAGNLPPEKNLVLRAATLFARSYPLSCPLDISLVKRIPAGAGLGGASSDAAAVLTGLNRLLGNPCPPRVLDDMAARLGSDVPFFLQACNAMSAGAASFWARVRGRGELIEPVAPLLPGPFWALLVHPGFFSGTPRAYALLDAYRERTGARHTANQTAPPFFNSFLPVLLEDGAPDDRRRLRSLLEDLQKHTPYAAGLSGSGSVCFALFTQKDAAEAAFRALAAAWPWRVLAAG